MTAFFLLKPVSKYLDNWLLENNAILLLDRNNLHLAISSAVAGAVVLDLDDYASDFAVWEVEHVLNDRCVITVSSDITD